MASWVSLSMVFDAKYDYSVIWTLALPTLDTGIANVCKSFRLMASWEFMSVAFDAKYDYSVIWTLALLTLDTGIANVCNRCLTNGFVGVVKHSFLFRVWHCRRWT